MRRLIFILFTLTSLTILAGCQPLIIPPTPTVERSTTPAEAATPATATTVMTDTVSTTATAPVSETLSATVALSESVAISETGVVSETVEGAPPAPTSTPSPENVVSDGPTLSVLVDSLRVRAGPGTEYDVIGAATQGEIYSIVGQASNCQWYKITYPQLAEAWVSGGAEFVISATSCEQIPVAIISSPTTPDPSIVPTAAPAQPQTDGNQTPTPAQPAADDDPFPPEKGCLLLQNQLGPPLTFTFTRSDGSFSDTFEVTSDGDVPYCLDPGYYRVTVDAPPPWSSLNTEFQIDAGQRVYFPIRPQ